MPRWGSKRAIRARPLSTTAVIPSIVTEVSATLVETMILRDGARPTARSCASAESSPCRGKTAKPAQGAGALDRLHGAADLVGSRHEDQQVAVRLARQALAFARGHLPHRLSLEIGRARQVLDRHRKHPPLRAQHLARRQVVPQEAAVEGRRHDDNLEIRAQRALDLERARERNVAVEMPLVKLVEDQRGDAGKRRLKGHLPQEDALGHVTDPRFGADTRVEPDLVADDSAQGRVHLLRHPLGEEPRRQAPRLEHDHLAAPAEQAVPPEHLRQLRRFARAGRRLHDQPAGAPERGENRRLKFVDGKLARGHAGGHGRKAGRKAQARVAGEHGSGRRPGNNR